MLPGAATVKLLLLSMPRLLGILAEKGSPIALAKLDATEEPKIAEQFEVRGYPTLKFFKNGKDTEYNGGRTADTIVSWLEKKTGPAAKTLATVDEAKAFVADNDIAIIGFFDSVDSDGAKAFPGSCWQHGRLPLRHH